MFISSDNIKSGVTDVTNEATGIKVGAAHGRQTDLRSGEGVGNEGGGCCA